jgi:hypothetical protein
MKEDKNDFCAPEVVVDWLTLVFRIREVPGSNLVPETGSGFQMEVRGALRVQILIYTNPITVSIIQCYTHFTTRKLPHGKKKKNSHHHNKNYYCRDRNMFH